MAIGEMLLQFVGHVEVTPAAASNQSDPLAWIPSVLEQRGWIAIGVPVRRRNNIRGMGLDPLLLLFQPVQSSSRSMMKWITAWWLMVSTSRCGPIPLLRYY